MKSGMQGLDDEDFGFTLREPQEDSEQGRDVIGLHLLRIPVAAGLRAGSPVSRRAQACK